MDFGIGRGKATPLSMVARDEAISHLFAGALFTNIMKLEYFLWHPADMNADSLG